MVKTMLCEVVEYYIYLMEYGLIYLNVMVLNWAMKYYEGRTKNNNIAYVKEFRMESGTIEERISHT